MLPRSFFEDDIWEERSKEEFSKVDAFLYLLKEASYVERTVLIGYTTVPLAKGQLIYTARDLAKKWSWSKNRVLRFMNYLHASGKISDMIIVNGLYTRICVNAMCSQGDNNVTSARIVDDSNANGKRDTLNGDNQVVVTDSGTPSGQVRDTFGTGAGHLRDTFGTAVERNNKESNKEIKKEGKKEEGAPAQKLEPMTADEIEDLQRRIGHSAAQMWVTGHREQCKTPLHAEQVLRWAAHKFEIKKPILGFSEFSALIKIFNAAPIAKATSVVDYSIANGYAGLFWDRGDPPGENKRKPDDHIAQIIDSKSYEKYANIDPQSYSWDAFLNAGKEPGTDG